jgi:hypothetical protein
MDCFLPIGSFMARPSSVYCTKPRWTRTPCGAIGGMAQRLVDRFALVFPRAVLLLSFGCSGAIEHRGEEDEVSSHHLYDFDAVATTGGWCRSRIGPNLCALACSRPFGRRHRSRAWLGRPIASLEGAVLPPSGQHPRWGPACRAIPRRRPPHKRPQSHPLRDAGSRSRAPTWPQAWHSQSSGACRPRIEKGNHHDRHPN